jgi:hypothetical protein
MKRLALLLLLPGVALAEERPVAPDPASCTPLLTVWKTGCAVEHAYRCADGTMLNVQISEGGTQRDTSLGDAEYLPIQSTIGDLGGAAFGATVGEIRMSHILATGKGSATWPVDLWTLNFVDPFRGTFSMSVQVTDRAYVVDGVTLTRFRAELDYDLNGGGMRMGGDGDGFIDAASGAMFAGSGTTTTFGTVLKETVQDPVALIYPGEPGFMNDLSETDCDPVSNLAPVTSEPLRRG